VTSGDLPATNQPVAAGGYASERPDSRRREDLELIGRLRSDLESRDREVKDLRNQLRAIQTSDAWAVLRTLSQLRARLAPHGTRRDRFARLAMRSLRRIKKSLTLLPERARRRAPSIGWGQKPTALVDPAAIKNYAVICLPMIEWGFRFQRPQQLMRQFARRQHLVLYAANRFHRGKNARTHPIETNILEVSLPGDPAANVYHGLPSSQDVDATVGALSRLCAAMALSDAVIVAQLPYWTETAEALRARLGWPIIYDCMDDHSGFLNNSAAILQAEDRLVGCADLVVASSRVLLHHVRNRSRSAILVQNACEYEHFQRSGIAAPVTQRQPRIGYYGAIAEWFDGALVRELARQHPAWRFELIGSTLGADVASLASVPNVFLMGERRYADLPALIRDWDIFIIPFKRVALTEATNPVKVYEMLATGKPVVAVPLPELVPIAQDGLIALAGTAEEFGRAIEVALAAQDPGAPESRRAFARANTWEARFLELAAAIETVRAQRKMERDVVLAGAQTRAAAPAA
jgi:hypothetical protein